MKLSQLCSRIAFITTLALAGGAAQALVRPGEVESLRAWLTKYVPGRPLRDTSGMVYEDKLPLIQERLRARPPGR